MTSTISAGTRSSVDRAFPGNLLALDRFARLVSYSPILFNQVMIEFNELQRDSSCSDPVLQYTWQPRGGGRPGREEIGQAIQQAEDTIYRALKFAPSPRWFSDEIDLAHVPRNTWANYNTMGVRANNFHIIESGTEAYAFVGLPALVFSDEDGDGYKETTTAEFSPSSAIKDINEVSVFLPGQGPDPAFEIRPIHVELRDNGDIFLRFARHLAVRPELQDRLDAAGIDGMADQNFVVEVEVYRHYSDPMGGLEVSWPCGGCGVCRACEVQTATGCFRVVDPRNGLVQLMPARWVDTSYGAGVTGGFWDVLGCLWVGSPARIKLNYRAGYIDRRLKRPLVEMAPELERAVAFLALSYLDREWITCEQMRNLQAHWRTDMAASVSSQGGSSSRRLDDDLLRCPFGTTRAALYAWRVVQPLMVGQAVLNV